MTPARLTAYILASVAMLAALYMAFNEGPAWLVLGGGVALGFLMDL